MTDTQKYNFLKEHKVAKSDMEMFRSWLDSHSELLIDRGVGETNLIATISEVYNSTGTCFLYQLSLLHKSSAVIGLDISRRCPIRKIYLCTIFVDFEDTNKRFLPSVFWATKEDFEVIFKEKIEKCFQFIENEGENNDV